MPSNSGQIRTLQSRPHWHTTTALMGKRTQEKQGGRDQVSDDEIEEVGTGFQMADATVLARRPMKGLPKRDATMAGGSSSAGVSTLTPSTPQPLKSNAFAGFKGPGATSATSPTNSTSTSASNPFSSIKVNGASSSHTPLQVTPSFSQPPPLTPASTMIVDDDSQDEELTSYRGLNQSFLSSVKELLQKDPFADISDTLSRYSRLRGVIKTESRENSRSSFPTPPSVFNFGATSSSTTPSNSNPPKMPSSAPITGRTFDAFIPPTPTSFSTKPAAKNDAAAAPETAAAAPKSFDFAAMSGAPSSGSTFRFGTDKATEAPLASTSFNTSTSSGLNPLSKPFSFGTPAFKKDDPVNDNPSSSESDSTITPKPSTSTFTFPSTSNASTSLFGKDLASKPQLKLNGDSLSASSSASSTRSLGFGTSGTSSGFGTSPGKGSLGNPVGFLFASPPKNLDADEKSSNADSTSLAFPSRFGSGAFSTTTTAGDPSVVPNVLSLPPALDSRDGTPFSIASGGDDDDEVLPGEEGETTIFKVKCRVSRLKTDGGKPEWKQMGVGLLKLKRDNKTMNKRILHRDSNSKRIILNAAFYKGLSVKVQKKSIFIGLMEDDKMSSYSLRVPTEEDAHMLKEHIDEEVRLMSEAS